TLGICRLSVFPRRFLVARSLVVGALILSTVVRGRLLFGFGGLNSFVGRGNGLSVGLAGEVFHYTERERGHEDENEQVRQPLPPHRGWFPVNALGNPVGA